ncbi:hypothetical protein ACB092_10G107200 [Castanea dentata]
MDLKDYSLYINVLWGDINLEEQLFSVSKNSSMLVQDSPLNDEVATFKKKTTRGINFSLEEDKLLVATWLNTSVDPVYVAKNFKDHKTDSTHSISSLTSRWGEINREINESGTIAEMKIEKARVQYEHCWLLLKDFSKWARNMPREDSRKEMSQTRNSIDQGGRVDDTMDFKRPIGRKAEKANQKRKDDGKDFAMEYLKKKKKIVEESCAHEKEKVRIKAENVRLQS